MMSPADIPAGRDHLDESETLRLLRLELLVRQERLREAQDVAEDLWAEATDAHRELYRGISNALTAACAAASGHAHGARQIARRTRQMLAPYPRHALGLDLESLIESLDRLVTRGAGRIVL